MRLRELIDRTAQRLARANVHCGHGTDNPRDEAAFLVLRGLGLPFDANLEKDADAKRVEKLVRQRIDKRVPAAYLLNEAWLDGVGFYVDRRVIIPRSHLAFLLKDLPVRPRRVLDLCTGSGCLAILAARAFPGARVHASDISASALTVARRNVRMHRMQGRIRLVQSDLFARLPGRYDLILANPPYVSTPAMRELPQEYRHEPGLALAAGRSGLDVIGRILDAAREHLEPEGLLVCEVGAGRGALARAYPRLRLRWPAPEVFILANARRDGASRTPPRRPRGK